MTGGADTPLPFLTRCPAVFGIIHGIGVAVIMSAQQQSENTSTHRPDGESLYRTRWLMAHNCLHEVVHKGSNPQAAFEGYLRELGTAEEVASRPA